MNRSYIQFLVILIAVGSLFFPTSAFSSPDIQSSIKEEKKNQKFNELKEKADTDKEVRVIVELDTSFIPEGKLDVTKKINQKNKIKQDQDSILEYLESFDAKKIHKFEGIPFIAMSVDKKTLERIEKSPKVIGITQDVLHLPNLAESVPLIGASAAWSTSSGIGQAIAILDTGVAKTHSAFSGGKIVSEACYSTTSPPDGATSLCPGGASQSTASNSALPCSLNGCDHGTHVAGIAAGNDATIQGVAKDSDLIAIQVFSEIHDPVFCGSPLPCIGAYTSDIIMGLERVLALSGSFNVASVNLSLGFGSFTSEATCDSEAMTSGMYDAVENLRSVGIATVSSSGNAGTANALGSPACISNVISVGSTTDTTDAISSFSNSASFLDLLAPGEVIRSSVPTGYGLKSGTSMASPHVAGAFAILKSHSTGLSVDQILNSLKNTGVSKFDSRNGFTFPRIQVDDAVNDLTPATWYDTNWQFRKAITINSAQVSTDLTNFPVLISITDAELGIAALANGNDILFTSSDGTTKLSHEIESWNDTPDKLVAWVKVPNVSSFTDTDIFMYYGNPAATNQENVVGTWDSNYKIVTHLHSDTADSTSNNNDGTNNGAVSDIGKIANSFSFDGINDDISFADQPSLDLGTQGTVSIWVQSTDTVSGNEFAFNWDNTQAGRWGMYASAADDKFHGFFRDSSDGVIGGTSFHGGVTNVNSAWHYVVVSYDGSMIRLYVDGVEERINSDPGKTIRSITNTGYLGKHPNNVAANRWEGNLDEFRVSNIARTTGWIQTEYINQNNPGIFYTVGVEET